MRFFEWNCIVKSVIFFAGFYWLWDFLLQILEWKKLIMSTGLVEIIFSKKKSYKYQILNHLYFGPSFVFRGTALGRFSQCFFLIFCRRSTMVSDVFIQPPHHHHHHKKASYSPVMSITINIITADISIFENLTIFLMSF